MEKENKQKTKKTNKKTTDNMIVLSQLKGCWT